MVIKSAITIVLAGLGFIVYSQNPSYFDAASELGISHTFSFNTSGSGVSMVDFNNDGLDDITLGTHNDDVIHFYQNMGTHFERIDLGLSQQENTKSILWVDYDNDGDKDLYIAAHSSPNKLYRNEGNLDFVDVTAESNLPTSDSLITYGAIWGDYNRDGWLDLYYTERIVIASQGMNRNRLWQNRADGTFTEVTDITGVRDEDRLPFCSAFVDMNNDKWSDIYIANDKKKGNSFLLNMGNETYTDISEQSGGGIEMDAMCVAPGDYNNDGKLDIYISNIATGGKLLTNTSTNDECMVIENAEECMVGMIGGIGWGSVFVDVDNDGWEDLYVSGMLVGNDNYSSQLFINDQLGTFYEDDYGFVGDTVRSFNNAIGDIDNDGQMEIMVINSGGFDSQLWKSDLTTANWIKVNLEGIVSNKDGIGAWIQIFTDEGKMQSRFTTCGNGFMGQNSDNIHFGIADVEIVDSVKVTWPTGHIDRVYNIESNQLILMTEGNSTGGTINIDNDINIITSITEITEFKNITLYPNPAINNFSIRSNSLITDVLIYNIEGELILHQNKKNIETNGLSQGIYFVTIWNGNEYLSTKKLVIL